MKAVVLRRGRVASSTGARFPSTIKNSLSQRRVCAMHGGSPLRSAPGADRSGHGDAEPAGSSHQPSLVFNVYICSARLPPCACSLACYSSNGIFQPQSTSRPPTVPAHTPAPACTPRCFGYRNHTPESPGLMDGHGRRLGITRRCLQEQARTVD